MLKEKVESKNLFFIKSQSYSHIGHNFFVANIEAIFIHPLKPTRLFRGDFELFKISLKTIYLVSMVLFDNLIHD